MALTCQFTGKPQSNNADFCSLERAIGGRQNRRRAVALHDPKRQALCTGVDGDGTAQCFAQTAMGIRQEQRLANFAASVKRCARQGRFAPGQLAAKDDQESARIDIASKENRDFGFFDQHIKGA